MLLLGLFVLLFPAGMLTAAAPECKAASNGRCQHLRGTAGSIAMNCRGEDYVFSIHLNHKPQQLHLFAECSDHCSDQEHLYYFGFQSYTPFQLNSRLNERWFNGSNILGMPSTMNSQHCKIFGCYRTQHHQSFTHWYNITEESCYPAISTTDSLVAITSNVSESTPSPELNKGKSSLDGNSSGGDNALASALELTESPNAVAMFIPAGMAVGIIFLVMSLSLVICFYKNKLRSLQRHRYSEKIFPNISTHEEFNFNLSKDSFYSLKPSNSLVSIIHSLQPPSHPPIERPTTLIFDTDNSNNNSLASSEYFKIIIEPNSLSPVEMSLADNGDLSDTSSLSAQSNAIKEPTPEVDLKHEELLFDFEQNYSHAKHDQLLPGSAPTLPRKRTNSKDFHDDTHHSLQMNGNQGNITTGSAHGFQGSSFSMERQQAVADSGYIADNICHQSVQVTTQTAEAVTQNAINDSGYLSNPVGTMSLSAIPAEDVPPDVPDLSQSDGLSNNCSIGTYPSSQQTEYLPSACEVVPTDVSSNFSHGTPSEQEFAALDDVDFTTESPSGDPALGPATGYQITLPTSCAAENADRDWNYTHNDSIEFGRSGVESEIPLKMSLVSLSCNTTIGNRDLLESLTSTYVSSTNHDLPQTRSDERESNSSATPVGNSLDLSAGVFQSRGLAINSGSKTNLSLLYKVHAPIPPLELTQESYVQMPVLMADTQSIFSRTSCSSSSADNITINLQSVVDDFSNEATEDSGEFSPDCSQPKYELCLNYPPDSEAVRKYREGYICSDLTIASENIQFYFPCQKASLCMANNNDQCNESSGFGSSPDSLPDNSPDNLNTCHFHFDHPLQTISHEECSLSNAFCGSNESVSESLTVSAKLNEPLHSFSSFPISPSTSSTDNIISFNFSGKELTDCLGEGEQDCVNFSFT